MRVDELDYQLPPELIATHPSAQRGGAGGSRLLHYTRADRSITHRAFADLPALLRPGDVMVFNDAKVTPARFAIVKPTGGRTGGLFLEEPARGRWVVLLKRPGPIRPDLVWRFDGSPNATAHVLEKLDGGRFVLGVTGGSADEILAMAGQVPLPPYLGRDPEPGDREAYQTVYAAKPGSAAAPTAGLHFTPDLLRRLDDVGVTRVHVTLHVGLGTFRPVEVSDLADHVMHAERYEVTPCAAEALNKAADDGRRIIAVGTTSARVLESLPAGRVVSGTGSTDIFIRPPYAWKRTDALVTNFHLPRSTLLALVAAMIGLDETRRVYANAVAARYRFFSYGDATFFE